MGNTKNVSDKSKIFEKVLASLESALQDPVVTDRDRAGIIQWFEFAYEATWKYLQKRVQDDGAEPPASPRKTFEKAYQLKIIDNENQWLEMMKDRNLTTHTYDRKLANEVLSRIKNNYLPLFQAIQNKNP